MIRHEMIELLGWRYQDMTEAQQDVLSRVENIVEVAVLRERYKTICAAELRRLQAQRDALLEVVQKYIAWSDAESDHKGTTFWERVEMCREVDELARAAIKAAEGEKQ